VIVIFSPSIEMSFSVNSERSIPATKDALQVINILRSPILYQVLLSLDFIIFVTTYSAVARSLIFCNPNTSAILEGSFFASHCERETPKINKKIHKQCRIMQFTKHN